MKHQYKGINHGKLKCNYQHTNNPFNMKHTVKGAIVMKKEKVNFNIDLTSPLWSIKNFSKLDMRVCG